MCARLYEFLLNHLELQSINFIFKPILGYFQVAQNWYCSSRNRKGVPYSDMYGLWRQALSPLSYNEACDDNQHHSPTACCTYQQWNE